jgi:hypothetical protein
MAEYRNSVIIASHIESNQMRRCRYFELPGRSWWSGRKEWAELRVRSQSRFALLLGRPALFLTDDEVLLVSVHFD